MSSLSELSTSTDRPPWALGAAEAGRLLQAGELSSVELVRALLARVERIDPSVNAVRRILDDEALVAASASDRRRAGGASRGLLDGVPFSVKENLDVAGTPTTQGVATFADAVAEVDAPAVARLRDAGAIPLLRTNMPDFALRMHTDSGIAGATRNPWDPERTPGGSSGGEAVALATGMSMLGLGNDLGGSLRWPASCAGIAALRPTAGRIAHATSIAPTSPPLSMQLMEVQGPMARRIEDLRAAFDVLVAPDPRDPWHVPVAAGARPAGPRRFRVLSDIGGRGPHPAVAEAIDRAAAALEDASYALDPPAGPGLDDAAAVWMALLGTEARSVWPALAPHASAAAGVFMDSYLQLGATLDREQFGAVLVERHRLARDWSEHQARTPLAIAPISLALPFAADADVRGVAAVRSIFDDLAPTVAVNALGLPSVAVPVGVRDGLPLAVQIIGPRFGEALVLEAAEVVERQVAPLTPIDPRRVRSTVE